MAPAATASTTHPRSANQLGAPCRTDEDSCIEELGAVQVIEGGPDALEMIPPDVGVMPRVPLPRWVEELPEYTQSVVCPAIAPRVPPNPIRGETLVVPPQQGELESAPPLGEPEQRHHVSKVLWAEIDMPRLPVDQTYGFDIRVAGIQDVSGVKVVMHDCIGAAL
jgi:hypothetical protein